MGGDPVFHVRGGEQRQKAVAAVGGVVVPGADGGVGEPVPPFVPRGGGREGGGRAVRHQDQVGDAGHDLAVDLRRGGSRLGKHFQPAVQPRLDVCVGIQRDGAVQPDLAGDLDVAVVAVVGPGGGAPVGDGQVVFVRLGLHLLQLQHDLGPAVEHHDADAVFLAAVGQQVDGFVD